jgi:hypothetical protein
MSLFIGYNVSQLQEVGDFYRVAFAVKDFSFTTDVPAEYIAPNFL